MGIYIISLPLRSVKHCEVLRYDRDSEEQQFLILSVCFLQVVQYIWTVKKKTHIH